MAAIISDDDDDDWIMTIPTYVCQTLTFGAQIWALYRIFGHGHAQDDGRMFDSVNRAVAN